MNRAICARLKQQSLTCFSATQRSLTTSRSIYSHCRFVSNFAFSANKSALPSSSSRHIHTSVTLQISKMTMNGSTRSKRKQHAAPLDERPQKLHRAVNGKESAGENTPDLEASPPLHNMETEMEMEMEDEEDDSRLGIITPADSAEWQATIEQVVRNVVSIRFCQTCAFDTDPALTSEATGFVVDAERGYILTNRHVVGSGPFW